MYSVLEAADTNLRSVEEINSFIDEIEKVYMLDMPYRYGAERRSAKRMNVTMPVGVTPLDDDLQLLDYHHHAITRDVSTKGLGLVTTNPIRRSEVLLTLEPCNGNTFCAIAKIIYCNAFGYYYQIGCEFLAS